MDATTDYLLEIGLLILGVLISYYVRSTRDDMNAVRQQLEQHVRDDVELHQNMAAEQRRVETLIAGQYVTRVEFENRMQRFEDTITNGFSRIYDKLDGKEDRR